MTHEQLAVPPLSRLTRGYLRRAYGYGTGVAGAVRPGPALIDDFVGGLVAWLPATPGGQLLDVGCGAGVFLKRMEDLGWTATGVESDPAAAAVAKSRGVEVIQAIDALGRRRFDAITLHHVIEHLHDPAAVVRELGGHLEAGGRVVVVTPNIESAGRRRFRAAWVAWDPPRHLWLFGLRSLTALLERAGYRVERAWTTARNARYPGTQAANIRRIGRMVPGSPAPWARMRGLSFQALQHAAVLARSTAGEEIVVVAARVG